MCLHSDLVKTYNNGFNWFQKIEAFEHRLHTHPLTKDTKLEEWYDMYEQKAKVRR